ncbi:MAG: carboxylating nicotinate-nucleotide diphosphorylase [Phycisphaerae bacterium]
MIDSTNTLSLSDLYARFDMTGLIRRLLELAHDEDMGIPRPSSAPGRDTVRSDGDITSECCIDVARIGEAKVVARGAGRIAGLAALPELMRLFAPSSTATTHASDGEDVAPLTTLATLRGPLDELLGLERTLLNLLGRLSGIATRTRTFARAMEPGGRARLYDTRKTTPGLRVLEKYAVRCGGGFCHRIGLFDAVLIKDNHIAGVDVKDLPRFIQRAATLARVKGHPAFIEVEVDTLDQFEALLTLPPGTVDIILLDNMSCERMTHAARRRDEVNPALELEASGGITLETIKAISRTGVDRISVGGLTHSAVVLDVAMDVDG